MSQIVLSQAVAASTESTYNVKAPFSGLIKDVTIHWPSGCNGLVDVAFGYGSIQLTPRTGYIALSAVTPKWDTDDKHWVKIRELLWLKVRNTDAANSHTITAVVTIEPRYEEPK